ncbi:MAG: cobalt-precorrin-5B (C(1))-methyltransferase CbiD [Firmicutes bacterium]|nr:cobalt-precorrin-5B (C(1))-methyltransferase CbiD [Bacillota bacterium]MBU4553778.1 cobalt-precorrin-5B (C(1))-methyltransferase CbiD [Bacillota bacterium]MBV1728515.1 cobalt-precorrin-5B (C(1))-methyltransferase CbiD [Desulforudis sp.]MBV1770350.1 cobalt-precorrin-5B (C(1))-methyltransferase CbiD [Desulforudis sp.]
MDQKNVKGVPYGGMGLRRGLTTGTCAAVAARGAALWLTQGWCPGQVTIRLPIGDEVTLPVRKVSWSETAARCCVIKDAGDDPDVTNGAAIHAEVGFAAEPGVSLHGGEGVGRVTLPGLAVPVGEAAINPVPRRMISEALADLVSAGVGWMVTISVPGGEQLARRTFNGRLGIVGGISILGTTGYVEPRSLDALRRSLPPLLDVVRAAGYRTVCLVPGNIGHRAARRLQPPPDEAQIVEMGDFLGFMLDEARARGFAAVTLVGHAGKLAKVLDGHWQTHSKHSPPANMAVLEFFAAAGLPRPMVRELMKLPTVEGIQLAVIEAGYTQLPALLAGRIQELVRERLKGEVEVSVHLCDFGGNIVGEAR